MRSISLRLIPPPLPEGREAADAIGLLLFGVPQEPSGLLRSGGNVGDDMGWGCCEDGGGCRGRWGVLGKWDTLGGRYAFSMMDGRFTPLAHLFKTCST